MLATALASHSTSSLAARVASAPASVPDALLQTAHIPVYTLTPFAGFCHKVVALMLSFVLTFGTYALIDPQHARFAANSFSDALGILHPWLYEPAKISSGAQTQVALAADNPRAAFARISFAVSGFARSFNEDINELAYAIAFPADLGM